jgi:Fe-S oxidoreductase
MRDEFRTLLPGDEVEALATQAHLFEEFVARERREGRFELSLRGAGPIRVHGHCHQKAAGVMPDMTEALSALPGAAPEVIETSCCGMAGAFGYRAETVEASRAMGELDLMPAVRAMAEDQVLVANGVSCRRQIADATGRRALHLAELLDRASEAAASEPAA